MTSAKTHLAVFITLLLGLLAGTMQADHSKPPLNILLITPDDLNYDSIGAYGCKVPGITPHLDRLVAGGLQFNHAHVNIAVCQPSRQSIMTARYRHRNGAEGFDPIDDAVPTLEEKLSAAGYLINFWTNRTKPMRMDSTSGLTFNAMKEAAKTDPKIAARVALFEHRVLEEFFDFEKDPHGLHNLINDPGFQDEVQKMQEALLARMKKTNDPALEAFQKRDNPAILDKFMEAQSLHAKRKKK